MVNADIAVRLTPEDLEAFAAEASRQGLSLACLIGALGDNAPIAWMAEQPVDDALALFILSRSTLTIREEK